MNDAARDTLRTLLETRRTAALATLHQGEPIFGLGDFTLFALRPDSVRVIAGFGAAYTISGTDFAAALA